MMTFVNLLLAVLLLALAAWTTLARSMFAAVVGFIAYGALLALAWVQLSGIDIALTEAAIGSDTVSRAVARAICRGRWSALAGALPVRTLPVAATVEL